MASIRLAPRTSSTSLIERSWPTASGVSVSGKVTVSRSGRTGSASGSGWLARIASSASSGDSTTSRTGAPSITCARSAPGGWSRRVAQRQLDPQHAVLVGGLGALGVDLDLELDDAAEGAGGDLDLLVDAALGLLHRPFADDRQVAAADLDPDLAQVDAGEVDLDDRPLRIAAVVDVDVGREARAAPADVARRPQASPSIWSISRRMRAKSAKRSRWGIAQNIARVASARGPHAQDAGGGFGERS